MTNARVARAKIAFIDCFPIPGFGPDPVNALASVRLGHDWSIGTRVATITGRRPLHSPLTAPVTARDHRCVRAFAVPHQPAGGRINELRIESFGEVARHRECAGVVSAVTLERKAMFFEQRPVLTRDAISAVLACDEEPRQRVPG